MDNVTQIPGQDRKFLTYYTKVLIEALAPEAVVQDGSVWKLSSKCDIPGVDLDSTYSTQDAAFQAIYTNIFGQFQRMGLAA